MLSNAEGLGVGTGVGILGTAVGVAVGTTLGILGTAVGATEGTGETKAVILALPSPVFAPFE